MKRRPEVVPGRPWLPERLNEFRTALEQEIDAARQNASQNAVPLQNGRRIGRVGGGIQYVFEIENILTLPDDMPADLVVDGRRIEATVVAKLGLTITISISEDLGPSVPTALLKTDLTFLLRKLIERIEGRADDPNPAGDRMLAGESDGEPVLIGAHEIEDLDWRPNGEQCQAVGSALGRNTTFIWGPPGTGKTHTIGAIGGQLHQRKRSLLLVSHTNIAVDGAVRRIGDQLTLGELARGAVVRVGDPADFRLREGKYRELLLTTHVERQSERLVAERTALDAERETSLRRVSELLRPIQMLEWIEVAEPEIKALARRVHMFGQREEEREKMRRKLALLRADSGGWHATEQEAKDAVSAKVRTLMLETDIVAASAQVELLARELAAVESELSEAEDVLGETTRVNPLVRMWRRLPAPEDQGKVVDATRGRVVTLKERHARTVQKHLDLVSEHGDVLDSVQGFERRYERTPETVLSDAELFRSELASFTNETENLVRETLAERRALEAELRDRLRVLFEFGLVREPREDANGMFDAIRTAHAAARHETRNLNLAELICERDALNARIVQCETRISLIGEELKHVAERIIAAATIVATTLTRAYLREAIQERRFDTVILDEASMAPIPALWVAAWTATRAAVVVGDFRQLPPIVLSQKEIAKKWLGRDVFEVAGMESIGDPPVCRVDLLTQYRMHPDISAVPNRLVYGGQLRDDERKTADDGSLDAWYRRDWGHDTPVLLVDTVETGAWATSVPRGRYPSRLNFLSATICVDVAKQLLREERERRKEGDPPRILMVCPYAPHAKLLRLLIAEEKDIADGEVLAGTAHSFQGREADVVIFDFVVDEPHWRANLFIPAADEDMTRLLNVALTRARRRLILIGDYKFMRQHGRASFLGTKLLPFVQGRYPCVDALGIVPDGLAARAASAVKIVHGGEVEVPEGRLIVLHDSFFRLLSSDTDRAQKRIVIYSPFMGNRLGEVATHLRAGAERGVRVYVVTQPLSERNRREQDLYASMESTLEKGGVRVIHKKGMHEKAVFVDDDILWTGSLNVLSHSRTNDYMERRQSRRVVTEYEQILRLPELVEESDNGTLVCPACGAEVIAAEGADDPYYWRCSNDDCGYTRSIGDPQIQNAVPMCPTCDLPMEYAERGGRAIWKCTSDGRHWRRMTRAHLLMAAVRDALPGPVLRELDLRFKIIGTFGIRRERGNAAQTRLF